MPHTVLQTTILDDQYGSGRQLAFPEMSTCVACICVLDQTMVAIHKTFGTDAHHDPLYADARALIGPSRVHGLYIAGWLSGPERHDIGLIRAGLGCNDVPTHTATFITTYRRTASGVMWHQFKGHIGSPVAQNVCAFATFRGPHLAPRVGLKRTPKVQVGDAVLGLGGRRAARRRVTTPSTHRHAIRFRRFH
jgi:hypothetical protein